MRPCPVGERACPGWGKFGWFEVHIRETEQEILDGGSRSFIGEEFESWRAGNLVGTPEQVAERIQTYIDLGCTGFYPWCSDYPDTETMRLLAEQVIPEVRRTAT